MTQNSKQVATVSEWSMKVFFIELLFGDQLLSSGTAFLVRANETDPNDECVFLVTNWHNVTGLHRDTEKCISPTAGRPDKLRIYIRKTTRLQPTNLFDIPLFKGDGRPNWLELNHEGLKPDIVAIPFVPPSDHFAPCINDPLGNNSKQNSDIATEIGSDVFIIGYPFNYSETLFPVWKRGSIATEPNTANFTNGRILVDTASRPGMSGSLVIQIPTQGIYKTIDGNFVAGDNSSFKIVGIYSGRIGANQKDMQLGIVWPFDLVARVLQAGIYPTLPLNPCIG